MAIPGRRELVPTSSVVRLSRDAPLPRGSGFASVLSGFCPGIAGTCSGTLLARQLGAHEYMSAWIWHCYQAGVQPSSGQEMQIYIEFCEEICATKPAQIQGRFLLIVCLGDARPDVGRAN